MLWWDWTARQRWALLVAILIFSAMPWLLLGWLPYNLYNLGALAGGTAFLAVHLIIAWFLIVGLRTGRIPMRNGSEDRTKAPTWFWLVAAAYSALLIFFLWIIFAVFSTF